MASDEDLWPRYFNDFIIFKLKLCGDADEGDIAQLILHTYFQQIHSYDALKKVVELHSYVSVYQLSLAQMASILRPLNKLQGLGVSTVTVIEEGNRKGFNDEWPKIVKRLKICVNKRLRTLRV